MKDRMEMNFTAVSHPEDEAFEKSMSEMVTGKEFLDYIKFKNSEIPIEDVAPFCCP